MSARNWALGFSIGAVLAAGAVPAAQAASAGAADRPAAVVRVPLPGGLGPCVPGSCPDPFPPVGSDGSVKGRDNAVNIFVGEDFRVRGTASEAEGRLVVLRDFDQDKQAGADQRYNVGVVGAGSLVPPPTGADFLTTGRNVTVAAGERLIADGGVVRHAGTLSGTVSGTLTHDAGAVAPYAGLRDRLTAASRCYAGQEATGRAVNSGHETVLTGDGTSRLQVFNVREDLVNPNGGGQQGIRFARIPAGATVLVNLLGDTVRTINTYSGGIQDTDPLNAYRERLLWNFPTAATVNLNGTGQFQGSVLIGNQASQTTVSLPGVNGRFFTTGSVTHGSSSLPGSGQEFHAYPFNGDLPDCSVTPPVPVTGSVSVLKRDEAGRPLAGARFELWHETNGEAGAQFTGGNPDTKVADCVTPADGVCARESELGTYYWRETAAPDGYVLPEQRVFTLVLTAENADAGVRLVVDNARVPVPPTGRVAVRKVDAATAAPLAGAVFELWRETNGQPGLQTAGADPDTLDENSCVTGDDGRCERVVRLGTYHWREITAPAGYQLPAQPVTTLVLDEAGAVAGVTVTVSNSKEEEEYRGVLEVLKKDAKTKRPLRGAVFEVWKETNGTAGLQTTGINSDVLVKAGCATDGAGVCTFAYLEQGSYYLRETDVPEGYVLPENRVTGPLRLDEQTPGHKLVVTVDNRRDDHGKGKDDGGKGKGGKGKGGKGGGRG
ncbi:choice-of-anchor A family protein [Streptomyces vinaceus]|uniref:choice-of-anchor A family protein n=1 Tax=Streptomyces vinaceus TaxID=1960 RepID=UPI00369DD48C